MWNTSKSIQDIQIMGIIKRKYTQLNFGRSGMKKQAAKEITGAYRFCGKIGSLKGLFGEGFSVFCFLPKTHTGFEAVSFESAYGL